MVGDAGVRSVARRHNEWDEIFVVQMGFLFSITIRLSIIVLLYLSSIGN